MLEPLTKADKINAVAGAAVSGLNDDLTVILSAASIALASMDSNHPARPLLLDIQGAGQRASWIASTLLNYSARNGGRPATAATAEALASAL
jgi:hypothetical protein